MTESNVNTLRELTEIQLRDGNWNYNEYMHGMANGMILALSIMDGCAADYLDAPDVWLRDIKKDAPESQTSCSKDSQ